MRSHTPTKLNRKPEPRRKVRWCSPGDAMQRLPLTTGRSGSPTRFGTATYNSPQAAHRPGPDVERTIRCFTRQRIFVTVTHLGRATYAILDEGVLPAHYAPHEQTKHAGVHPVRPPRRLPGEYGLDSGALF